MIDKENDGIGVVLKDKVSQRQLDTYNSVVVVVGKKYSHIEVYGPLKGTEKTGFKRLRIRNEKVKTSEVAQQARRLCDKFRILRQNVEIKHEQSEKDN